MNKHLTYIQLIIILLSVTSCSTQKNTWATRFYHTTTTKYNIYFNGNNSYQDGLKAIDDASNDDYSQPLPLYPISNEGASQAATSQMDRTIEKCRKCIKLHSIKKKPKPNPNKRSDPKYKLFMQQEEYNSKMGDAWLLLGKAEFHKGEFLSSIGTFNYIIRHYSTDKDIIAQCQLWITRAYAELGWIYEAEDMLGKVKQDDLKRKHAPLYAAAAADLRLKQKQYAEAIPFVKLAMQGETRQQKTRELYILAQLQELNGKNKAASELYKKVINRSPVAVMDFNARLRRTELSGDISQLKKMAKQPKYKDKLDYIYGAIGNIYLQKKDTTKALENYDLACENSTESGTFKASILIKAADLYYNKQNYVKAGPYYQEAANIISTTHEDYARIRKLSETLDELITEYNTVQLQDSLQHLATLTEKEQLKIVKKIISDLEKAEKEAAEKNLQDQRASREDNLLGVDTRNMLGGRPSASADWYFYNAQLMRTGKTDFSRKWGNRQLEDNWRRTIKTGSGTLAYQASDDEQLTEDDSLSADTTLTTEPAKQLTTDIHDPQYYLQQIPKTEEDIAQSDTLIANALYNMAFIYHDKLEDIPATEQTIDDFNHRFPRDERLAELWFRQYLNSMSQSNIADANINREKILTQFPESKEAGILRQPNYFENLAAAQQQQDSLYEQTYKAYTTNRFEQVKLNTQYAEEHFPMTKLMPRFLFLNALAIAKTESQENFIGALRDMVTRYPESETGAMAKDMLAMMNQGMESQTGTTSSTLADKRAELTSAQTDSTLMQQDFNPDRKLPAVVLLTIANNQTVTDKQQIKKDKGQTNNDNLNKLLYEVALFNFSQFMIKDFDLKLIQNLKSTVNNTDIQPTSVSIGQSQEKSTSLSALQISGFDSYDETVWYSGILNNNTDLQQLFNQLDVNVIRITEDNLKLIGTRFTLEDYLQFQINNELE